MIMSRIQLIIISLPVLLLSAAVTSQANPPCYICDNDPDATISNPSGLVPLPADLAQQFGITQLPCSTIYNSGKNGNIPSVNCLASDPDADALQQFCGCSNFVASTEPPVEAPVTLPVNVPVSSPTIPPVVGEIPVVGPTTDCVRCGAKNGKKSDKESNGPKAAKESKATRAPKVEKGTTANSRASVKVPSSSSGIAGIEGKSQSPVATPRFNKIRNVRVKY